MPTTTLTNGLVVANFSSVQPIIFVDSRVLAGCTEERYRRLQMPPIRIPENRGVWYDTKLVWSLNKTISQALVDAENQARQEGIDIVVVPMGVLEGANARDPSKKFWPRIRNIKINHCTRRAVINEFYR
jgi:hypothetical protein